MVNSNESRSVLQMFSSTNIATIPAATRISREPQCELRRAIMTSSPVDTYRVPILVASVALATAALVGALVALY